MHGTLASIEKAAECCPRAFLLSSFELHAVLTLWNMNFRVTCHCFLLLTICYLKKSIFGRKNLQFMTWVNVERRVKGWTFPQQWKKYWRTSDKWPQLPQKFPPKFFWKITLARSVVTTTIMLIKSVSHDGFPAIISTTTCCSLCYIWARESP